jgi:hypothetical protein
MFQADDSAIRRMSFNMHRSFVIPGPSALFADGTRNPAFVAT